MTKPKGSAEYMPGKLIVRLREGALKKHHTLKAAKTVQLMQKGAMGLDRLDAVLQGIKCRQVESVFERGRYERVSGVDLENYFVLQFPEDSDLDEIIERLEQAPDILSVEREPVTDKDQTPNDPRFTNNDQWHLPHIEIEDAWRITEGAGTVIGIYDVDGVHCQHVDLNGNRLAANCSGENSFNDDHGTRVTGVCAAVTDNNLGVAGAAWDSQFIGVRSSGASSNANSIRCLVDQGSDVIVTSSPITSVIDGHIPGDTRNAIVVQHLDGRSCLVTDKRTLTVDRNPVTICINSNSTWCCASRVGYHFTR